MKINIEKYPAVKKHLLSFTKHRLEQSGAKGSRKKTNNMWFETQDTISYWEDFSKQKIVWARLMRIAKNDTNSFPRFSLIPENMYTVDSLCFITGNNLDCFVKILNSKVASYYFFNNIAILDNGGMQMRQQYIENFPIAKSTKKFGANINSDTFVFSLYNFNDEEINFVTKFLEKKYKEIGL